MKAAIAAIVLCVTMCYTRAALASAHELEVAGTRIKVEVDDGAFRGGANPIVEWVTRSAQIVAHYYDRFPTSSLRVRVIAEEGDGVRSGKTWGYNGGFIRIQVGRQVTGDQLHIVWVLVHVMTHLALPDVGDDHDWLSEGLAVYVEGVARVQAGNRAQM